jgi:hypothetical protein
MKHRGLLIYRKKQMPYEPVSLRHPDVAMPGEYGPGIGYPPSCVYGGCKVVLPGNGMAWTPHRGGGQDEMVIDGNSLLDRIN